MNALDEMLSALASDKPTKSTACGCEENQVRDVVITQGVAVSENEEIQVEIPAVHCDACGLVYTDYRAEKATHDAICHHRELLTPDEIKAVRRALGLSRTDFADAYGIAPASMERWENGRLMQSVTANTLLVALSNVALAHRLDRRKKTSSNRVSGNVIQAVFGDLCAKPTEEQRDILERQSNFTLRLRA